MEDTTLLKIAVICSISGLVLLYFTTLKIEPKEVSFDNINEDMLGKVVRVSGKIVQINEYKSSVLIKIENNNSFLDVFAYKSIIPDNLEKGKNLSITGQVKEYKGNLEIVPIKREDFSWNYS